MTTNQKIIKRYESRSALLFVFFLICNPLHAEEVFLSALLDTESDVKLEWVIDSSEFAKEPEWDGTSALPTSVESAVKKARDSVSKAYPGEAIAFRSVSLRPPIKRIEGLTSRLVFIIEFDIGTKGKRANTVILMTGKIILPRKKPL
jgi:hypothetical protein